MSEALGTHTFCADDLQWFAGASGDYNPIHVDPVAARRLIAGTQVVHGMFTLLSALDFYYRSHTHAPQRIKAYFQKPVLVGDAVQFFFESIENETRVFVRNDTEEVASIRLIGTGTMITTPAANVRPDKDAVKNYAFTELKDHSGIIPVTAAHEDLEQHFSHVAGVLGGYPVAAIMAFSRIIGMECPGLHSLFTGLDVTFSEPDATPIEWRVSRHLSPYAPIQVQVEGGGVYASLDAFVRPAPVAQASISDVQKIMDANACRGQRALIIGGSRGLGELVAKCVVAGGGDVCITYAHGKDDALALENALIAHGSSCDSAQLDVMQLYGFEALLDRFKPTHIYYFATTRIRNNAAPYNQALYEAYEAVYVEAFSQVARAAASSTTLPVRIFYPSTVFVDDTPKGFAEYADAKKAGEEQCRILEAENPNLHILIKRLPRMKTDQTASLMPVSAKPALQEMQQVVIQMQTPKHQEIA